MKSHVLAASGVGPLPVEQAPSTCGTLVYLTPETVRARKPNERVRFSGMGTSSGLRPTPDLFRETNGGGPMDVGNSRDRTLFERISL